MLPTLSRGVPGDSDPCCQTCGRGLTTKTATIVAVLVVNPPYGKSSCISSIFDPRIQKKAGSGGLGVHFGRKQPFD